MLPWRLTSIDAIYGDILLLEIVLDHLHLLEAGSEVLVLYVTGEYDQLEVATQVAKAVDATNAYPHAVLLLLEALTTESGRSRRALRSARADRLYVRLRHQVVLTCRYTVVLEEVAEHALKRKQQYGPRNVRCSARERLSECVLEVLGRLRHHGRLQLSLRQLQCGLG